MRTPGVRAHYGCNDQVAGASAVQSFQRRNPMNRVLRAVAAFALAFALPMFTPVGPAAAETQVAARVVEVLVDGGAYAPAAIDVARGERVALRFVRSDHSPCAAEVVFPSLGLRRALPVGEPVEIEIPTDGAGEVPFHCGMKMLRGKVIVRG